MKYRNLPKYSKKQSRDNRELLFLQQLSAGEVAGSNQEIIES
jgi:hypothetical protein